MPVYHRAARDRVEEDDEDEDEEEEEEEEEEESEEDAAPKAAEPELSRTERRELKKKKAQAAQAKKQANGGDEDEDEEDDDPLLVNPNHAAGKRMNLADLSAPRELTRRERYVIWFPLSFIGVCFMDAYREEKEKKEAKERYWKVTTVTSPRHHVLTAICS